MYVCVNPAIKLEYAVSGSGVTNKEDQLSKLSFSKDFKASVNRYALYGNWLFLDDYCFFFIFS